MRGKESTGGHKRAALWTVVNAMTRKMTRNRKRKLSAVAAASAIVLAGAGTGGWAATQSPVSDGDARPSAARTDRGPSPAPSPDGMMNNGHGPSDCGPMGDHDTGMGPWMMGGSPYGLVGTGQPVRSIADAKDRAQAFADRLDLRAGEVMQFTCDFYAELDTAAGRGATEVLIDPDNGAVRVEHGPALVWNTEYGLQPQPAAEPRVSAAEARRTAQQWLDDQRAGLSAGEAEAFPGYYTLRTLDDGKVTGLLSVNATNGQIWEHTWHGDFTRMS